jgi:GT2 family glycosyltransferase
MISFVILHYKNINDTIECLKDLKVICKNHGFSIIVVDNNTLNKKEILLIKKLTKDLIILKENIGYAKANNLGVDYALKKYSPDFICVLNNDVFITKKNFIDIIYNDEKSYKFDLLGPKIISSSGESINPFPVIKDYKAVKNEIKKCRILIQIYSNPILFYIFKKYLSIKKKFIKGIGQKNGKNLQKNVALHGCCIIFNKKYFQKYSTAFNSCTFLFHEEEFIYQRIIKSNLISVYDPKLEVYHKEGSSMKDKNIRKQKLYREKERVKSLLLLLKEMK